VSKKWQLAFVALASDSYFCLDSFNNRKRLNFAMFLNLFVIFAERFCTYYQCQ
jgi:hypothetical protein